MNKQEKLEYYQKKLNWLLKNYDPYNQDAAEEIDYLRRKIKQLGGIR